MSAFAPEEYAAHLVNATRLPVSHVEVVSQDQTEYVNATIAETAPIRLPAWNSERELKSILAQQVPYLHAECMTLSERLELIRKCLALRAILLLSVAIPPEPEHQSMECFNIDDEEIILRLSRFRQSIRDLLN